MTKTTKKPSLAGETVVKEAKKRVQSKYDPNKLRALILQGLNAAEIMKEFDINHKQVLKHWTLALSTMDKKLYQIPGLYDLKLRQAYVNQQGQIKLHMKNIMWNNMTLKPDDEFTVEVTENQIILTKKLFTSDEEKTSNDNIVLEDQDIKQ